MVARETRHDTGSKKLLKGVVTPAGQPAQGDVDMVVANVFLHPNTGPFVAQHLIRQLVTSNPSPAYIARVATAFNNDGNGVRGDMKAVLRAVLLDPEARGDVKTDPRYGMLREPVLYIMAILRGLDAVTDGNRLYEPAGAMGQDVFYSPTVFNYYPADYRIPGTTLLAPQFGIHNTNTVLHRANFVSEMIDEGGWSPDTELAGAVGTKIDITPFRNVAGEPVAARRISSMPSSSAAACRSGCATRSTAPSPRCPRASEASAHERHSSSRSRRSSSR